MSIFPSIPRQLSSFITRQLYLALPPAPDDTPETLEARDLTAMAAVVRLGPANTAEALFAVQAVAAQQHASDALQSVAKFRNDFKIVGQCRAQSAMMMRQAATALRELRTLQEARLALLAQQQAEQDAAAQDAQAGIPPEDAAEARDVICASPGLSNLADAWRNRVQTHKSHGMGLHFASRYIETESPPRAPEAADDPLMASLSARMTGGYHTAYPG